MPYALIQNPGNSLSIGYSKNVFTCKELLDDLEKLLINAETKLNNMKGNSFFKISLNCLQYQGKSEKLVKVLGPCTFQIEKTLNDNFQYRLFQFKYKSSVSAPTTCSDLVTAFKNLIVDNNIVFNSVSFLYNDGEPETGELYTLNGVLNDKHELNTSFQNEIENFKNKYKNAEFKTYQKNPSNGGNRTGPRNHLPYEKRTLSELRSLATSRNLQGRSGLTKSQLVELLRRARLMDGH